MVGEGRGFPREVRLRRPSEFRACFEQGRRVSGSWLVLVGRPRGDQKPARFGLAVARKVGSAVVRNRLRRQLRESFRTSSDRQRLVGVDLVAVVRTLKSELPSSEVRAEFHRLLFGLLRRLS